MTPAPKAAPLLGRAEELGRAAELLQSHRFVTIAGPGGMGKTTLARAVVAQCAGLYPDGVHFIDLAVLAQGRALDGVLGAALGIAHLSLESPSQLAACLRGQRLLIVFDCCEHHTAVAARACEVLLQSAPGIDVLCTSREPLLAHSERILRLGPMGIPELDQALDVAAALGFPAVALFVARAASDNLAGFAPDADQARQVCEICRSVDGVPLAIELAAALVRPLGLHELARQTSRWLLAPAGASQPPDGRHRTLSGMLNWSYDALVPHEQGVLRRLSVFRGHFTLEGAAAVASCPGLGAEGVIDTVIELAGKSLVSMSDSGGDPRARLLDLTRDYAHDKLASNGELNALQERHARWLCTLMEQLERDWMALDRGAWMDRYAPWVDDVLAAIDWALGPGREPVLGAQLAGIGFSLGDQIGVAGDFHERVQRALAALGSLDDVPTHVYLRLNIVSAHGPGIPALGLFELLVNAEWVMRLARQAASPMLQGASLLAIWGYPYVRGDYPASLAGAGRIARAASAGADPYLTLMGQRTMAQSLHFMGRHAEAHHCATLALAGSELRIPLAYQPSPVQVGTSVRIILARLLWMQGAADRALAMSEEALAVARSDRPAALCQVLAMAAIPVAIWRGETGRARVLVQRLRERSQTHGLVYWTGWAAHVEHALAVLEAGAGATGPASAAAAAAADRPADAAGFFAKCTDHMVTFSSKLLTDAAVRRCDAGVVGWCLPELLRARAAHLLESETLDAQGEAAALLRRSLAVAQAQGALAWSLRSATSLAALYRRQGAVAQARAALAPILARFDEGGGTADLCAARALLAAIA